MHKARPKLGARRDLPPINTRLIGKYFDTPYRAKIVKDNNQIDGKGVLYRGKVYSSMTAAARAITRHPISGWRFWKIVK